MPVKLKRYKCIWRHKITPDRFRDPLANRSRIERPATVKDNHGGFRAVNVGVTPQGCSDTTDARRRGGRSLAERKPSEVFFSGWLNIAIRDRDQMKEQIAIKNRRHDEQSAALVMWSHRDRWRRENKKKYLSIYIVVSVLWDKKAHQLAEQGKTLGQSSQSNLLQDCYKSLNSNEMIGPR